MREFLKYLLWKFKIPIFGFIITYSYYKYLTWNFKTFKKLGIKGPRPLPALGNLLNFFRKDLRELDLELKEKYGSVVGCFNSRLPFLLVFEGDILRQILIKDFHLFANHQVIDIMDSPLDKMLTLLEDEHWKQVRSILSPTFSTGKMKMMISQMNQCCDHLCQNLEKEAKTYKVFDFRKYSGAFSMDVIGRTAFGIEIDSHNDPNNQFIKIANKVTKFQFSFVFFILIFFPFLRKVTKFLGFRLIDKSVSDFFISAINQSMQKREKNSPNKDFLQLMIDAHLENEEVEEDEGVEEVNEHMELWKKVKLTKRALTTEELYAQGLLFFIVGYETTANALASFVYLLALHPLIQDKLYHEINQKFSFETKPDYNSLNELKYLDMCFKECLRMFPVAFRTDRVASEKVTYNNLTINKGMTIHIPIYALQNDPLYWEEPKVFKPERFDPKYMIDPFHYMPFGLGPRKCIGMRLANFEVKLAICRILKKFKLIACQETEVPLKLETLSLKPKNGIKIKIEFR